MRVRETGERTYQAYSIEKRLLAGALALVATLTGGGIAFAKKNNKKLDDTKLNTLKSSETNYSYTSGQPFKYNVEEMAQKIYNNYIEKVKLDGRLETKGFLTLGDIKDIIYFVNYLDDDINYDGLTEQQKLDKEKRIMKNIYELVKISGVYSVDLFAKDDEYRDLSLELKKAIETGNSTEFSNVANKIIGLTNNLEKNDAKQTKRYVLVLLDELKGKGNLKTLTVDKNLQVEINKSHSKVYADISKGFDIDVNEAPQVTTTPHTNKNGKDGYEVHKKADAGRANANQTTVKFSGKGKEIEKGGKRIASGTQTVKSSGTTRVETKTFKATVDVKTGQWTVTQKGGKVVSEKYVDSEAKKAEDLVNTTTTTTKVTYSDANKDELVNNTSQGILIEEGGESIVLK